MEAKPFKPYGTPPTLDLEEYKDCFEVWKTQWEVFLALSTIDSALTKDQRPTYKTNILLSCLSKSTLQIVLTAGLTAEQLKSHTAIIAKLEERCNAGRNHHFWRHEFASRKQTAGERVDDWLCELRDLSRKCEFSKDCCGSCEATRILGQVVYGVAEDETRRKLLEKGPNLTLDEAVATLKSCEAAALQSQKLKGESGVAVCGVSKMGKPAKQSSTSHRPKNSNSHSTKSKCSYCGAERKHARTDCPANGKECRKCGKTGHFKGVCRSKGNTAIQAVYISSAKQSHRSPAASKMVKVKVIPAANPKKTVEILVLPDTGADIDAIPKRMYKDLLKGVVLSPAELPAFTAIGERITSAGTFRATFDWITGDGKSCPVKTVVHVLKNLRQPVLSKNTQKALQLLPDEYPHVRVTGVATKTSTEEPATRPFEIVHADLATIRGRDFLVMVDQFSGWPHVAAFADKNTSARRVVDAVRRFFVYGPGAPVKIFSDNGPQFTSAEFRKFLSDWGIAQSTSSPHYPQSNGLAETTVKSMKKLIEGAWVGGTFNEDKFGKSLLLFRNAPKEGAASPAQLIFGRPVRDLLPAHRRSFEAKWQKAAAELERKARRSKEIRKAHYDERAHTLRDLDVGSHVLIQHPVTKRWDTPGVIVEVGRNRDYMVKTPAGRIFRRNRRFLRRRVAVMPGSASTSPPEPVQEPIPLRRSTRIRKPPKRFRKEE